MKKIGFQPTIWQGGDDGQEVDARQGVQDEAIPGDVTRLGLKVSLKRKTNANANAPRVRIVISSNLKLTPDEKIQRSEKNAGSRRILITKM